MYSSSAVATMYTTIFVFSVFLNCIQIIYGNRLPLELYEVSSKQVLSDQHYYVRQRLINHSDQHRKIRQTTGDNRANDNDDVEADLEEHAATQKVRILYQFGNSEEDLPICAPNAVCSKIDLYEKPWIERQCRCPKEHIRHLPFSFHPKDYKHLKNYHRDGGVKNRGANGHHGSGYDGKTAVISTDHAIYTKTKHLEEILWKLEFFQHREEIKEQKHHNTRLRADFPETIHQRHAFSRGGDDSNEHHDESYRDRMIDRDFPTIGGCSSAIDTDDGHTIADKTRQYKMCDPIHTLPTCRYFRDFTWTLKSSSDTNITEQTVYCKCPRNSVSYLIKREPIQSGASGFIYYFACSPQSRLRCLRKEPCMLFTVRKRQELLEEVNTNPLCQCPRAHRCPRHHTESGVIVGKSYAEDDIQTYSGYCMPV